MPTIAVTATSASGESATPDTVSVYTNGLDGACRKHKCEIERIGVLRNPVASW